MHKKRGGQVAIEFIFLIVVAFAVSIIFTYALIDKTQQLNDEKEFVAIQDISFKIQNEISIASNAESGYMRDFELPNQTHFIDYNISVTGNSLIIRTENKEYVLYVPSFDGNLTKGWNRICKDNGDIHVQTAGCTYTP